jgi:hypothetical protein
MGVAVAVFETTQKSLPAPIPFWVPKNAEHSFFQSKIRIDSLASCRVCIDWNSSCIWSIFYVQCADANDEFISMMMHSSFLDSSDDFLSFFKNRYFR